MINALQLRQDSTVVMPGEVQARRRDILRFVAATPTIDLVYDLVYHAIMEVNIHKAKTHLSRLLERVALGEEVIIAKAGKPVAKLVSVASEHPRFKLGSAKGEFVVPDDFNDPLPKDIEDLFW